MVSFVQAAVGNLSGGCTLGAPSTTGDLLVFGVSVFQSGAAVPSVSVSDTGGNTWFQAGPPSETQNYGLNTFTFLFYALNIKPGAGDITATAVVSGSPAATATELSEYSVPSNLIADASSYSLMSGSVAPVTFSTTLVSEPELLVAIVQTTQTGPPMSSGWSDRANNAPYSLLADCLNWATSGSQQITALTQSSALAVAGVLLGFYPYVAPTPPAPPSGISLAPAPTYPNGPPGIKRLSDVFRQIRVQRPNAYLPDWNGNIYSVAALIRGQWSPGGQAKDGLFQTMVEYCPELGTIVWVSGGIRQGIIYAVAPTVLVNGGLVNY